MNYYSTLTNFIKSPFLDKYFIFYAISHPIILTLLFSTLIFLDSIPIGYICGMQSFQYYSIIQKNFRCRIFIDIITLLILFHLNTKWYFGIILLSLKSFCLYFMLIIAETKTFFRIIFFIPNITHIIQYAIINRLPLLQIFEKVIPLIIDLIEIAENDQISVYTIDQQVLYNTSTKIVLGRFIRNKSSLNLVTLSEEQNCIICYENFNEGFKLKCNHTFCTKCVLIWYSQHDTCVRCFRSLM